MKPLRCYTLGQAPGLAHKHYTRLERLVGDELFTNIHKCARKKFYNIGTSCNIHKTSYKNLITILKAGAPLLNDVNVKSPVYFMIRHPKQINEPKASNSFQAVKCSYTYISLFNERCHASWLKKNIIFFKEKLFHKVKKCTIRLRRIKSLRTGPQTSDWASLLRYGIQLIN